MKPVSKLIRTLSIVLLLLPLGLHAQTVTVSGTVIDTNGGPMAGVAVVSVQNPTLGVATGSEGTFIIQVAETDSLRFSFLGYQEQVIPLGSGVTNVRVVMQETSNLVDEVVVIGYGTARRKDVTGSIASVSAEKLESTPSVSLNQALQGKAAGVQVNLGDNSPGGGVSVLIRGQSSITQGNAPIYVVDGIIMEGTLNNINVNDIASIDILKDASAAAIYGSRAANGVIIVTTKRGSQGQGKINFSARTSIRKPSNLPKMLNAQELAMIRIEGNVNDEINEIWRNNPNMTKSEYSDLFYSKKEQYMTELPSSMFSDVERQTLLEGKSYNWYDRVSQNGIVQDYTLSLSGANDVTNYYISGNFYDERGLVKDSGYQRLVFRVNLEQKINRWLRAGINSSFTSGKIRHSGTSLGQAIGANPMYPFYIDGEEPLRLPFYTASGQSNPILSRSIQNDGTSKRYSANIFAVIDLTRDLFVRSNVAFDVVNDFGGYFVPSNIDQGQSTRGAASITNNSWVDVMQENTVNYSKVFGEKHRFSALMGNTIQVNRYKGNYQYGTGFATNVMGYKNIGSASEFPASSQSSSQTKWQMASFIARANYSYDDRYLFTATARYDGNSKFGNARNSNKWGMFPSFSAAWRISNEQFMPGVEFIDDLKLRLGWGQLGNSSFPAYSSYTQLSPGVTVGPDNKPVNTIHNSNQIMGNPNIQWERQQQVNAGLDFAAFRNRLRFTFDIYEKTSKDLILLTPIPVTTGYLNIYSNIGQTQNKGIEIAVGGRIIDRQVKWDLDFNWSTNRNRIKKLYGGLTEKINDPNNPTAAGWWVGKPIGTIYTYVFDGLWQWDDDRTLMDTMKDGIVGGDTYYPGENKIRDLDGDDQITTADRTIVGYTDPKGYGGLSTSISYKGFTLGAVFNYVYGNKVWNRSYHEYTLGAGYGFQNLRSDQLQRWTIDNPHTDIPRAGANNLDRMLLSSRVMQNGSYLRMKNLTLTYDFPKLWTDKIRASNLSVFVSGENLWTLTKYKGADPESVSSGYDETYPNGRAVSFGLNITF